MPATPLITQASDCFALGAAFEVIQSEAGPLTDLARASQADGAWGLWRAIRPRDQARARYLYAGSDLRASLPWVLGQVLGGWKLDRLRLLFRLHEPVELELLGHQHAEAPHVTPSASGSSPGFALGLETLLPAGQGPWGLPAGAPWAGSDPSAALQRLQLSFELEHEDVWDAGGTHLAGADWAGQIQVQAEYLGEPVLDLNDWQVARQPLIAASQDFARTRLRLWRPLTRLILP